MLSEQEQTEIRLLSDNELYQQAVEFMKKMGKPFSSSQINGLVNVSLSNTYDQLKQFVECQGARQTWPAAEKHVQDFYRTRFPAKLKELESFVPVVTRLRLENASWKDEQTIKMELAREFLQHLLAENGYREALGDFRANEEMQQRKPGGGQRQ